MNKNAKNHKKILITIIACLCFVFTVFFYTVTYRIDHVTALDSAKYHQAKDKYMNTESYH